MPINTQDLMLRLQPGAPLDFGSAFGRGGSSSLERERLKLMREEFENLKAHQAKQDELERYKANQLTAKAQLDKEAKLAEIEAAKAAKNREEKLKAEQEFLKLAGQGDIEGAHALVPLMTDLGMGVELEGEEDGLPRYRIDFDAKAAAAERAALEAQSAPAPDSPGEQIYGESVHESLNRLNPLGYPTNERGVLDEPAGIPSTEDAFTSALAASYDAEATGQPRRGPDAPDLAGAVPKNVIDMGAMESQTLARLRPQLSALVDAYPESENDEYRSSARKTAEAVSGRGMTAAESLKQFDTLRSGPDSLIKAGIDAEAQAARFKATQDSGAVKDGLARKKYGSGLGKTIGATYNIDDLLTGRRQTKDAIEILSNKTGGDDHLALALISRRMGERGATTEPDIARALGISAMSTIDQIKAFIQTRLESGLSVDQRNNLLGVLKNTAKTADETFTTFLDKLETEAELAAHPDEAEGLRSYGRLTVPPDIRAEWEAKRKGKRATADAAPAKPERFDMVEDAKKHGPVGGGEFNMEEDVQRQPTSGVDDDQEFQSELERQAKENDLDPEKIRVIMRPESAGDPSAESSAGAVGIIQLMPNRAREVGTTSEELKKMSRTQQLPFAIKYLKKVGKLTAESSQDDYYMALAAPAMIGKPDDTVVYKKDSPEWDENPAWRPSDGGDITVGDLKRYGRRGVRKPNKDAEAKTEPKTGSRAARLRALTGLK